MQTVSTALKNRIKADDTYYELKLTNEKSDGSSETLDVQVSDLKITNLINADGFSIGETCSSCLEFTDTNNTLLPILGSKIKVALGVNLKEGTNTYTGDSEPSMTTYPTSDWGTDTYASHVGDIYYTEEIQDDVYNGNWNGVQGTAGAYRSDYIECNASDVINVYLENGISMLECIFWNSSKGFVKNDTKFSGNQNYSFTAPANSKYFTITEYRGSTSTVDDIGIVKIGINKEVSGEDSGSVVVKKYWTFTYSDGTYSWVSTSQDEIAQGIEYVNMGYYIIQKPEIETNAIKYTGYDLMTTLEQDSPIGGYNPQTGERDKNPCTIAEYMNQLVLFAQQRASANSTPSIEGWEISSKTAFNSGKVITIPENVSMRQMVGYIAMIMGCNAYIDRNGNIVFKGYETTDEIIDDTRIYDGELKIESNEAISVGAVTCTFKKENVAEEEAETTYTKGTVGSGVHLTINDNPLIKRESDVDFIYNIVSKYSLMSVTAKTLGNPLYDVGDIIYANNENTPLAIMNIEFEYDGGLTNAMTSEMPTEAESTYRTTSSVDIQAAEYAQNFNDILKSLAQKVATNELSAKVAEIDTLTANSAIIKNIYSDSVATNYISAINAELGTLKATDITAESGTFNYLQADKLNAKYIQATDITADSGKFNYLQADKLDTKYINTEEITAESGTYHYLTTDSLNANYIKSDSASIANLVSRLSISDKTVTVDGSVTGQLSAVEINANNINTGSLSTDRLIIKGTNGSIVYAINNMGELVSQNVNSIDGYVLTDRTISADKIIANSITATEIDVASLIASQAFISQLLSNQLIVGGINSNIVFGGVNVLTNSKLMTNYTIKEYLSDGSNRLTDGSNRLFI